MGFDFLFAPVEQLDAALTGLFAGATLPVALLIALALGLRHASDPDHLVAVTSLVAADDGGTRRAARLGMWWGLGHGAMLLAIGLPVIFLKSSVPPWVEAGAEKAVGVLILALALRVLFKWVRGDFRASSHDHGRRRGHRHLRREAPSHGHTHLRTPRQALAIGMLHGLAG